MAGEILLEVERAHGVARGNLEGARVAVEGDALRDLEILLDARLSEELVELRELLRAELRAGLRLEIALDEALLRALDRLRDRIGLRGRADARIREQPAVGTLECVRDLEADVLDDRVRRRVVGGEDRGRHEIATLRRGVGADVEADGLRVDGLGVLADSLEDVGVLGDGLLRRHARQRDRLPAGDGEIDLRVQRGDDLAVGPRLLLGVGTNAVDEARGREVGADGDGDDDRAERDRDHVALRPEDRLLDLGGKRLRHYWISSDEGAAATAPFSLTLNVTLPT